MDYYLCIYMHMFEGAHALCYMEDGRLKLDVIYRFSVDYEKKNGHLTWNTDAIFKEILNGMKKCKELGKIPKAIGITSIGFDYVLLDENKNQVGDCYSFMDDRSHFSGEVIEKVMPETEMFRLTGLQKTSVSSLYQLVAGREQEPWRLDNTKYFLTFPDYFNFRLTGEIKTDKTCIYSTQLINPNTGELLKDVMEKLDIRTDIFSEIIEPGTVVSDKLLADIAEEVGFDCSVYVPCGYDTVSILIGAGCENNHSVFLDINDYGHIGVTIDKPDCSELSRKYGFGNNLAYEGYYYSKLIVGAWYIIKLKEELCPKLEMPEINKQASEAEISSIISFDAYIDECAIKELLEEKCRESGQQIPKTVGQYFAILFRSLARAYADAIRDLSERTGQRITNINVLTYGEDDSLLCQWLSDYTSLPVTVAHSESKLLGVGEVLMVADGVFADISEAQTCAELSFELKSFMPQISGITDEEIKKAWNISTIIIYCAKLLSGSADHNQAIRRVLHEISKVVHPDRITIIGIDNETISMLYEWHTADVPAKQDELQNLPINMVKPWLNMIEEKGIVIMKEGDILPGDENIHRDFVESNRIRNLIEIPLYNRDEIIGFLGVENFVEKDISDIQNLLESVSFFISTVMINERLVMELRILGNTDMLTGVFNRNAMNARISELNDKDIGVGVLYADVNGLKRVNDELGHIAGDALIKRAAGLLMQVFDRQCIFRAGGDEFVVIMADDDKDKFLNGVSEIERILSVAKEISIAIGYKWTENAHRLDQTVREADEAMYADKQRYYKEHVLKPR